MDIAIDELLTDLGYRSDGLRQRARAALIAAGLTSERKQRIAESKLAAVRDVLAGGFALACTRERCRQVAAASGKTILDVDRPTDCAVCHGSANESAIHRAVAALQERGMRRLVIVGGSPNAHTELEALIGDRIEIRLIPGTDRRTGRDAAADRSWAHLIVIWGGTQLNHQISKLYTDGRRDRVVTCPRRGIAALAETVLEAVSRRE